MVKLILQKGLKVVHESYDPEVYYIYNERMRLQKQFIEVRITEDIDEKYFAQIALLMLDNSSSYEIPIILANQPPDSGFIWYRVIVDVVELIDNLDPLVLIETLKDVWIGYDISMEETDSKVKSVMYQDMVTKFGNIDNLIANANKDT